MAPARASGSPYDGYVRRVTPAPDPELTPVGPGTPGGEYLRRFWQPVAFARDLNGPPRRVRILGEDLVVFRDRGGRNGVLHLHCGLVFAYLGPPDRRPAFPLYDSFEVPGHTLMPAAEFTLPCNWLQVKDNSMD